jgi:hypothetical protein
MLTSLRFNAGFGQRVCASLMLGLIQVAAAAGPESAAFGEMSPPGAAASAFRSSGVSRGRRAIHWAANERLARAAPVNTAVPFRSDT